MADPTNEELAERLEDMAGAAPRRDTFSKTDTETCRLAAARLRQPLPSGDGWTKIEDGEPVEMADVDVVVRRINGKREVIRGLWRAPPGKSSYFSTWEGHLDAKYVTHWRPPPALPQEDE